MYSNIETDFAKLKENAQLPYKQDQLILIAGFGIYIPGITCLQMGFSSKQKCTRIYCCVVNVNNPRGSDRASKYLLLLF